MARIRRVDCSGPGIRRRRRGRSFSYEEPTGETVTDPEVLARIRALAIQYLYHEAWRTRRDQAKFDHMLEFAHALPGLRERAAEHLAEDRYRSGLTIAGVLDQLRQVGEPGEPAHQGPIEEAVLDLIEGKHAPAPELDLIA